MPMIHVHAPAGTFTQEDQDALANELVDIGCELEMVKTTPAVLSFCTVYFIEVPVTHVYHSHKRGGTKIIIIYFDVLAGCLDQPAKDGCIKRFTEAVGKHTKERYENGWIPCHVILRDVLEPSWGFNGEQGRIKTMRDSVESDPSIG